MATGRILVKKAMQKAGILAWNESPSASEASDGLDALNDLVASWANDDLLCFARTLESFPLTGANEYTIGTGQTFDTARPTAIIVATIRCQNTDTPLSIIPDDMFEVFVADKASSGLPRFLTYDNGFPVGKIRLAPAPISGYVLRLMTEKPLSEFTLDTDVELPPGWRRTIITNLGEDLRADYSLPADPGAERIARDALGSIKMNVARNHNMDANPSGQYGANNIYTGWGV
jgi:hypothetical protein